MRIPWYIAALGASVIWGIHYPLLENALRKVSLVTVLTLTAVPMVVLGAAMHRQLVADWEIVRNLETRSQLAILAIALTSLCASVLLMMSIESKNATLASLLEISYPVFVALFAYAFFRHAHVSPSVWMGAALIFAGVFLIIWNNPA